MSTDPNHSREYWLDPGDLFDDVACENCDESPCVCGDWDDDYDMELIDEIVSYRNAMDGGY